MIVWAQNLYIGEQAEKNHGKIMKKLEKGKLVSGFFLITKPSNDNNLFDILPAKELLFPYYKQRELVVYGLAKDKAEAENLVVTMLEDIYRENGGLCCKEYFKVK